MKTNLVRTMIADKTINSKRIKWAELVVFYLISVLVSAPFRLQLIRLDEIIPLPYGLSVFYRVLRGIGPAIGFFAVYYILKSSVERKFTFWGVNKLYSVLAVAIIPLFLGIAGLNNQEGLNQHYYGFITGIFMILYALGEEYGWRGYLQQALEPLKFQYRILLIALLWYVWHLSFLLPGFSMQSQLIFFAFLVLGSWGLLKITESSFSILFAAAVHIAFNILTDSHITGNRKIIVLILAATVWTILMISLSKNKIKIIENQLSI